MHVLPFTNLIAPEAKKKNDATCYFIKNYSATGEIMACFLHKTIVLHINFS
jgi:hypothetical protein